MIKPRDGEMNYEDLNELAFYYIFVGACLSNEDYKTLKNKWNEQGGHKQKSWWQFIMENAKIELDFK